jgi:hypothetical protein
MFGDGEHDGASLGMIINWRAASISGISRSMLSNRAPKAPVHDVFQPARDAFEDTIALLSGAALAHATESQVEDETDSHGNEVKRLMLLGHLELRSLREQVERVPQFKACGDRVRCRRRSVESRFGRVYVMRAGVVPHQAPKGTPARFPLDEELNLPSEIYSHPVRRCVVEEVRKASFGEGVAALGRTTGAHVPKRQMQELTKKAAQDFEAFYEQRKAQQPADPSALLLLSSDAGGVCVRKEALREATLKAATAEAEKAAETPAKGDPMASKKLRNHDKRMAMVTLVADQPRHVRTPEQILANIEGPANNAAQKPKPAKAPKPTHKTLLPTLIKPTEEAIKDMFDEADRRDPKKVRETVCLLDGQEHQKEQVLDQAKRRNRLLVLILDIIHVIHYLWIAAKALRAPALQWGWVVFYFGKLLRCKTDRDVSYVVAGISRSATAANLSAEALKAVGSCTRYLLNNKAYLHYAVYLALGYPIATGAIEGAIRYLIRDRMDITGARWGLLCGDAVLRLRALHSNDDFDEYWEFHLAQERLRHYPALPANDNAFRVAA